MKAALINQLAKFIIINICIIFKSGETFWKVENIFKRKFKKDYIKI